MPQLLLIDDSAAQCELVARALAQQGPPDALRIVGSTGEMLAALEAAWTAGPAELPRIILIDLHLRSERGVDVIRTLRRDPRFAFQPIIVLTSSDDPGDIRACYAAGANGYVTKPATFEDLVTLTRDLGRFWIGWNRVATPC